MKRKQTLALLLSALLLLGAASAMAAKTENDGTLVSDPLGQVLLKLQKLFPSAKLIDATQGAPLGFDNAPKMTKYRYAMDKKDATLSLYHYASDVELRLAASLVNGYALVDNGRSVYAATSLPYTWYTDGENALFLYCGLDKNVNKTLTKAGIKALGGYFMPSPSGKKAPDSISKLLAQTQLICLGRVTGDTVYRNTPEQAEYRISVTKNIQNAPETSCVVLAAPKSLTVGSSYIFFLRKAEDASSAKLRLADDVARSALELDDHNRVLPVRAYGMHALQSQEDFLSELLKNKAFSKVKGDADEKQNASSFALPKDAPANAVLIKDAAVYGGASTAYEKLGTLQKGTRISIAGESMNGNEKWFHIKSSNEWSCVRGDCVQTDASYQPVVNIASTDGGDVFTGRMRSSTSVRSGPGSGYNNLGKINKGAIVAVDEISGSWARLREFKSFGPAWVKLKYVEVEE